MLSTFQRRVQYASADRLDQANAFGDAITRFRAVISIYGISYSDFNWIRQEIRNLVSLASSVESDIPRDFSRELEDFSIKFSKLEAFK